MWLVGVGGWGEWSSKDRVGSLGLVTSGEPGASAPTLVGCCATRVIDCAYPSTLVCEICLNFVLESLRVCRRWANVVAPPCVHLCCRPRGCGVAQQVGEALERGSPRVCGFVRRPRGSGVAQQVGEALERGSLRVCGFAHWLTVRAGARQVFGCAVPRVRSHILFLCTVARQEAEGEVGAYFSSWLRTRVQAQEVRPGQLADKAVDESEWTSWSRGWRIGPRMS
jgi:hypothetical protein